MYVHTELEEGSVSYINKSSAKVYTSPTYIMLVGLNIPTTTMSTYILNSA